MTMKIGYGLCCFLAITILLVCVSKMKRREERIGKIVEAILWIEVVIILGSTVTFLSNSRLLMAMGNAIFRVGMNALSYAMVQYACEYTKNKSRFLWIDDVWKVLLLLDAGSMLLNPFFGHAAEYVYVEQGQELYLTVQPKLLYIIHFVLCYTMVAEIIIRFVLAVVKSPGLYRIRYMCMLIMFLLLISSTLVFLFVDFLIDWPVLFFAASAAILTYFTFYYIPNRLRNKIKAMIFREMRDSVAVFDDKGNCVYLNNKLEQNDIAKSMKQQKFEDALREAHDKNGIVRVDYGEEVRYYEDRYDELRDEHGRYLGCFYFFRDVTLERKMLRKQFRLANYDALTGLYNRNRFMERSEVLLRAFPDEDFVIICSDISKFKVINEIFGLKTGDKVLKLIGASLLECRGERSICGRFGEDSFALCAVERDFDINEFVKKTNEAIAGLQMQYPVVNHIGVYRVEDRSLSVSAMCDRAMLALHSIKDDYQREIAYYDDALREALLQEQEILKDVQQAFEEEQFEIFLQPQINHKDNCIIGAEALVRWKHPVKGYIPPDKFVPLLESNGLITQLDMHVWELACKQLRKWKEEKNWDLSLSVNVSTKDFFYVDLNKVFTGLIQKYDIPVSRLKLEITESAFSIDLMKQLAMIEQLQKQGFIIEMDDFGSGYSSLNILKDIPVDIIKMDMAFMSQSDKYKRSEDILRMVIKMANKLKMPVIAEGVETKEQADVLGDMGCHIIQGYYYAKPMPVAEFENLMYKYNEMQSNNDTEMENYQ